MRVALSMLATMKVWEQRHRVGEGCFLPFGSESSKGKETSDTSTCGTVWTPRPSPEPRMALTFEDPILLPRAC